MALHQRISDWLQPNLSGQLQDPARLLPHQVPRLTVHRVLQRLAIHPKIVMKIW